MRIPLIFAIGFCVVISGCETETIKKEYLSLDVLKKTEKFRGYDLLQGPVIKRTMDGEFEELEGPFRLSPKVFHTVIREEMIPFHRCLYLNQGDVEIPEGDPGIKYEFKHEDCVGYGFRFIGVENPDGDIGVIFLKTKETIPTYNERHKERIERNAERWKHMMRTQKKGKGGKRLGGGNTGDGPREETGAARTAEGAADRAREAAQADEKGDEDNSGKEDN